MAPGDGDGGGSKGMSSFAKLLVLVFFGMAVGVAFNEWSATLPKTVGGPGQALSRLDLQSYGVGLVAGMLLWQIGIVPWGELPGRFRQYLLAKTRIYQFAVIGAACVLVLIYF
jgi:hypothetical protein